MKRVLVLLSTYNGEKYLDEQLKSIFLQENVEVHVLARDDGSQDKTLEILKMWAQNGKLKWYSGENLKPARSFLDLICAAEDYDYYALSDQDDYWLPDKLYTAVTALEKNKAQLYYSATTVVDSNLHVLPQIEYPQEDYNFFESLMYNHISGCTMVFDARLRGVLKNYIPQNIIMHDWWLMLVCKALDMKTVYDPVSRILYRQHEKNCVGLKKAFPLKYWLHCLFKEQNNMSIMLGELLEGYRDSLKVEKVDTICLLIQSKSSIVARIKVLSDKRLHINSSTAWNKENIGFALKIIAGRI